MSSQVTTLRLICCGLAAQILLPLSILVPATAPAQEAIILSGGGSRGLVHAGVIEAIEQRGYDADIVVGTSMGAVVGALYAAGYEPQEIIERVGQVDWTEIFTPTPVVIGPDRTVRYPLVNFDLLVEERRVSRGLISQWRINRALAALLFDANSRAGGNFDRLTRRYRAVAADLRTGDIVVLSEGDLARAARASMAVPGMFAPMVWGDRILVDGGITDNLPTHVARELGASRIVAVDVSKPSAEILDRSPFGTIWRAIDLMQENARRDTIPPDFLIVPEVDAFGATSFPADPRPLFQLGRDAVARDFAHFSAKPPATARRVAAPPESISRVVVEAADSALSALAGHAFAEVPGPYEPAAVIEAMDLLYSTGLFEGVWPRVVSDSTGESVLLVQLDSPPRLAMAASAAYENDRGALAWISLDRHGSIRRRPMVANFSASTAGLDHWASVSATIFARDHTIPAWSLGLYARERDVRFFFEDGSGSTDVIRFGGWAAIEFPHVMRDQLATVTFHAERVDVENDGTGLSYGPLLRFTRLNPDVLVIGHPLLIEAEHRWGEAGYSRAALRASRVFEIQPLKLAPLIDLIWTTRSAPADVQPALGDDHAIPGLRWGERRAPSRAVLGLDAAVAVRPINFRLRLRTGVSADEFWNDDLKWVSGSQIAAVWQTPIWSAEVGWGVNTSGGRRLELAAGRQF